MTWLQSILFLSMLSLTPPHYNFRIVHWRGWNIGVWALHILLMDSACVMLLQKINMIFTLNLFLGTLFLCWSAKEMVTISTSWKLDSVRVLCSIDSTRVKLGSSFHWNWKPIWWWWQSFCRNWKPIESLAVKWLHAGEKHHGRETLSFKKFSPDNITHVIIKRWMRSSVDEHCTI